jgi:hypothetical protein
VVYRSDCGESCTYITVELEPDPRHLAVIERVQKELSKHSTVEDGDGLVDVKMNAASHRRMALLNLHSKSEKLLRMGLKSAGDAAEAYNKDDVGSSAQHLHSLMTDDFNAPPYKGRESCLLYLVQDSVKLCYLR